MDGRVFDVLCIVVDDLVDGFLLFRKIFSFFFILLFFFIVNAKKLDGFVAPGFSVFGFYFPNVLQVHFFEICLNEIVPSLFFVPLDVVYHLIFCSREAFLVDRRQKFLQDVQAIAVSAFESALLPFLFLDCFLIGYFLFCPTRMCQ